MATFMTSLSREQLGILWIASSTAFAIFLIVVIAVICELDRVEKMQFAAARSKRKGAAR